jgi:RND family efflux transporter MFP subunit
VESALSALAIVRAGLPVVLSLLLFTGCNNAASKTPDKKPPEVVVTSPVDEPEVVDYQDFTGRLDSLFSVEIRARASGFIKSAPFKEGDMVKKDDLLFLIDPAPYQADFNLAQANLKLAEADQVLQQKNSVRAAKMMKANAMAVEDYDTAIATWEKSQATVAAMAATRDRAKEYLGYTRVLAPWNGRISRRFVDPGNLVNADNTVLTTLVQDDKLYAYFDVDERTYLEMGGSASSGSGGVNPNLQFPVLFRLANEEQFTRSGVVNFVDNRVNAGTGTIRMRALFDNNDGDLRAGLFVRIRLPIGAPFSALTVPAEAVLSDQGRKYVYIVNDKNEVEYRKVTVSFQEIHGTREKHGSAKNSDGPKTPKPPAEGAAVARPEQPDAGDDQVEVVPLRIVRSGLKESDRVIIVGMQRVRTGASVQAKFERPPKSAGSPLRKLLAEARKSSPQSAASKPASLQQKRPAAQRDAATGRLAPLSEAGH